MLQPKKQKYRKLQKLTGKLRGISRRGSYISFGTYALKSTTRARVTARQIEAARRAMTRYIKRSGKIWIRIFPDVPVTKTAAETPQGSGKGSIDRYIAMVRPGRILFEMDGVEEDIAREAMRLASHKLPVQTKFIVK